MISQKAIDLIIASEVTSKEVYEKQYQHPEWPGVNSGITVGIGYDLGYATKQKIKDEWGKLVTGPMLAVMQKCAGITGSSAEDLLPSVKNKISVPWDSAMDVFSNKTLPEWESRVLKAIPKAKDLSPHCLGAIVSLAYNRGPSFDQDGDRYKEMRAIKAHINAGKLDKIPAELRSMKRIWTLKGLKIRRENEALLFEEGLKTPAIKVVVPTPPVVITPSVVVPVKKKPSVPYVLIGVLTLGLFTLIATVFRNRSRIWSWIKNRYFGFESWLDRSVPILKTKFVAFLGFIGSTALVLQEYIRGLPLEEIITPTTLLVTNIVLFTLAFWLKGLNERVESREEE